LRVFVLFFFSPVALVFFPASGLAGAFAAGALVAGFLSAAFGGILADV